MKTILEIDPNNSKDVTAFNCAVHSEEIETSLKTILKDYLPDPETKRKVNSELIRLAIQELLNLVDPD